MAAIEIPATEDCNEWEAFLRSYSLGGYSPGYISYHSFRHHLENKIRIGEKFIRDDYSPPQRATYDSVFLHIVEIPEAT